MPSRLHVESTSSQSKIGKAWQQVQAENFSSNESHVRMVGGTYRWVKASMNTMCNCFNVIGECYFVWLSTEWWLTGCVALLLHHTAWLAHFTKQSFCIILCAKSVRTLTNLAFMKYEFCSPPNQWVFPKYYYDAHCCVHCSVFLQCCAVRI